MTTSEKINIMLAYERGENIEYKERKDSEWLPLLHDPDWDWSQFEYRIKSKPTYRPYKNADELLQAQREHGMYLRPSGKHKYMTPITISCDKVTLAFPIDSGNICTCQYSYRDIFEDFTWQDGTPCGVEE